MKSVFALAAAVPGIAAAGYLLLVPSESSGFWRWLAAIILVLQAALIFYLAAYVQKKAQKQAEKTEGKPFSGPAAAQPKQILPPDAQQEAGAGNELTSFGFIISHEIKSPIRAIDGYARIFLEDYGEQLGGEARGMIETIRQICKEAISLTNKLLEYTRIAQSEPTSEVVDLEGTIREVFDALAHAAEGSASIRLIFETPLPHALGDPTLLRLALSNIISNALKFTRREQAALICVGCEAHAEGHVFYIRDNGAGFDMQYSQKLFSMFQRMHTSDEFEGTGVGLAIVKKVIFLHQGRVWINGEVGKGATVYFSLPSENVLS